MFIGCGIGIADRPPWEQEDGGGFISMRVLPTSTWITATPDMLMLMSISG